MAYYFSATELIKSVKRRANIPDSQDMITDAEILDYANEEMMMNIVPLIIQKHENYFLTLELEPTNSTSRAYPIPYRSIGNRVREVAYTNNESPKPIYHELHQIPVDEITSNYNSGRSNRFYIQDESIVIDQDAGNLGYDYIAFWYYIRPNQIVESDRVAIIRSIDRNTGVITVSNVPDNFGESISYDFVRTKSPHRIITYDIPILSIDVVNKLLTFSPEEIPDRLEVGDRISMATESDLVNIPTELHSMLAQSVSNRVLESIGDIDNLNAGNKKLTKMENNSQFILDNRVEGSPIKAKPRNGLLRSRRRFRR